MNYSFNENVLTVVLCRRIDSNNAPEVEKEIFGLIAENNAKSVILDAAGTEYISSAGLRVLLKLKKAVSDSKIINVSPDVYEILDVTGFSEILTVEKALRSISVEGCEKIGEGGFGIVYRLNSDTIVKLYKAGGLDAIRREMNYAKKAFIKGVPTAISYDIVTCGDKYGVVFELIRSDTLANALMKNPDKFEEYVRKYVELVKSVHATDVSDFITARTNDLYRHHFEELKAHLTEEELLSLNRLVDSIPNRNTMVHGDLHTGNIMLQGDELLLIDMDELMCGHPLYDLCNIYFAYTFIRKRGDAERFFGINDEMCDRLIKRFTELYFDGLSPEQYQAVLDGLDVFGMMRYAYTLIIASGRRFSHEQLVEKAAHYIRDSVLPRADIAINALNYM